MRIAATSTGPKADLRDHTRKLTLTAESVEEAEWLAAVYRSFVIGDPLPCHPAEIGQPPRRPAAAPGPDVQA